VIRAVVCTAGFWLGAAPGIWAILSLPFVNFP
jgi:hypothetical protein